MSISWSFLEMRKSRGSKYKTDGKQGEHFVLSLEANNKASYKECMIVGYEIADYFKGFQVAFAVHINTNNRHIHFVVNSVSYKDGKKFSQGPNDMNDFKIYCNRILDNHNFDNIKMKTYEMCDNESYYIYNGLGFIEAAENTSKVEPEMNVIVPYDEYANDYDSGESAWKSRDEARATMNTLGWEEHPNDKCYCPQCLEKMSL